MRVPDRDQGADDTDASPRISRMDRRLRQPRIARSHLIALVGLLAIAVLFAVAYTRYGRSDTLSISRERVTIATVTNGSFAEFIPLTGNVVPQTTVYLDAVDGGQVVQVLVDEGASVTAGQPLVKLKNTRQELEVMRLEAELTQQLNQLSTAKLSFAQATLQHDRELIDIQAQIEQLSQRQARRLLLRDSGAVSRAEIEDGETELKRFRRLLEALQKAQTVDIELQNKQVARIEQAATTQTANLKLARGSLDSLAIVAPISGQLSALNAHVGEAKNAGQRLGQIDELTSSKVSALVDEFYLARVRAGQTASADIDDHTYDLRVVKVYPDVRERQFKVDLQFAAPTPASIRLGQTLQLRLAIGPLGTALQVANGPYYEGSGAGVFVVDKSGDYADRRKVQLGRRTPDAVEITAGLAVGERIITSSYESYAGIQRLRFL